MDLDLIYQTVRVPSILEEFCLQLKFGLIISEGGMKFLKGVLKLIKYFEIMNFQPKI